MKTGGRRLLYGLAALASAARASACTVYQLGSGSIAHEFRELLALHTLLQENGTFYVQASASPAYGCTEAGGILDFVEPVPGLERWSAESEQLEAEGPCLRINRGQEYSPEGRAAVDTAFTQFNYMDLVGNALPKVWRLKAPLQKEVERIMAQLKEAGSVSVGFYVDGGMPDGGNNLLSAQTAAAQLVQRYLQANPSASQASFCLVVGEDLNALAAVAVEASNTLGCTTVTRDWGPAAGGASVADRCLQTLREISTMELLAHTDYFVGSLSQPVPQAVETLRYGLYRKARQTFVDASPARGDWYQNIRDYLARGGGPKNPAEE